MAAGSSPRATTLTTGNIRLKNKIVIVLIFNLLQWYPWKIKKLSTLNLLRIITRRLQSSKKRQGCVKSLSNVFVYSQPKQTQKYRSFYTLCIGSITAHLWHAFNFFPFFSSLALKNALATGRHRTRALGLMSVGRSSANDQREEKQDAFQDLPPL